MNIVAEINQVHTYAEIVAQIRKTTGRIYSEGHIGNVARGAAPLNDKLLYNLERSFPEFFVKAEVKAE